MSVHASQAFSIAHCTDLEDLPNVELYEASLEWLRNLRTQWLRFRQEGTQEIYFPVLSKTTPTTILVAHRNCKTNLNANTNPNPDLQKTCKRSWKKNVKKL